MASILSETKLDLDHVEHVDQAGAVDVIIDEIETVDTGNFIWLVSITASIGGLLFGYDTGIISGVLVYLHDDLGHFLSASEKELVTSLCSAGAFVGAIAAGLTADKFGRKVAIYFASVLFTVGAVIQAAAYSLPQMAVGRLVVGFGVGCAAAIVPLYLAEIAPARYRGRVIGLNNMSITFGAVIAYAIGAAFAGVSHGWRYMVGLGAAPSVILFCLLPFVPESPRQLIFHGHTEQARQVLEMIYRDATPAMVDDKIRRIQQAADQSKECLDSKSKWAAVKKMHTDPACFRALVCACGLMVISQMSGFNTLLYYSGTLFSLVGFSNPVAVGTVVAAANFCCTGINAFIVDRAGRRRVLLLTVWGMSAGLIAVAIAFTEIPIDLDTLELKQSTVTTPAIVVLFFIIWFCIFYGLSVGNIAWMSTDFFSIEVRAIGTMWMTCCNWGPNLIVSSTFLTMMKSITPSGAFGFYGALCGIGWLLIIFFYPEVSGLTIEEVSQVFRHGFGVRYARELRKQRQTLAKSKNSA